MIRVSGTIIDSQDRDARGKDLSPNKRAEIHRLRKWQNRMITRSAEEKNLKFAMSELDRIASQLGISKNSQRSISFTLP